MPGWKTPAILVNGGGDLRRCAFHAFYAHAYRCNARTIVIWRGVASFARYRLLHAAYRTSVVLRRTLAYL